MISYMCSALIGIPNLYVLRVGGVYNLIGLSIATTIFFQIMPFYDSIERSAKNIEKNIWLLWDYRGLLLCYASLKFWKFMVSCTIHVHHQRNVDS